MFIRNCFKYISFIMFTVLFIGCTKTISLNDSAEYAFMIGKIYLTQQDFIITSSEGSNRKLLEFPGSQGVPKIENIKTEFPYKYEANTILGVLPKGSIFKIENIERVDKFESTIEWYSAKVISDGKYNNMKIDVTFLIETKIGESPRFNKLYAVENK